MEILSKLFGNEDRVKIMRLFISNGDQVYDKEDVVIRAKSNQYLVKHEISNLEKIGLIQRRSGIKKNNFAGKSNLKSDKKNGWTLNPDFPYLKELQSLLISRSLFKKGEIAQKFEGLGKVKLLVVAGVFIQDPDSRIDLLVVGDGLKAAQIKTAVGVLESEIGKEIRYTVFDTAEFKYRIGMCDKLLRDILDYPHEKVIDKITVNNTPQPPMPL
ncbi:MAG: hypothetical protein WCT19_03810 [Candidatus Paceibacterota bacterium]